MTYHNISVLLGLLAGSVELQAVLNLLTKHLAEFGGGVLGEVVDSAGDAALVGKVTGDTALVLGGSLSDICAVVL